MIQPISVQDSDTSEVDKDVSTRQEFWLWEEWVEAQAQGQGSGAVPQPRQESHSSYVRRAPD